MSNQSYFQFLREAHPLHETLATAYEQLTDEERAQLDRLRRDLPDITKEAFGTQIRWLGPHGFLELLTRLALARRAKELGLKIDLSNAKTVREIMNSVP